jgi:WD40 repeat protein
MRLESTFKDLDQFVHCVAFSADGTRLFALRSGHQMLGWQIQSKKLVFDVHSLDATFAFTLTPDDRYLITAGSTWLGGSKTLGELKVWEAATGHLAKRWPAHGPRASCVAFNKLNNTFCTGGHDGILRVWAFPSCKEIQHLEHKPHFKKGIIDRVLFACQGKKLVYAYDVLLYTWDPKQREAVPLEKSKGCCFWPTVSRDGNIVAACMFRSTGGSARDGAPIPPLREYFWVRLWDAATGKILGDLECGQGLRSLAFHPDGRHLLSVEGKSTFRWWALERRQCLSTWHTPGYITTIAISPDGKRVATGDGEGTVRIWKLSVENAK